MGGSYSYPCEASDWVEKERTELAYSAACPCPCCSRCSKKLLVFPIERNHRIDLEAPAAEEFFDFDQMCPRKSGRDVRVSGGDYYHGIIRIINSTGFSGEPCGTPDSICLAEEAESFATAWNLLYWKYDLTVFRILAGKPQYFIFRSNLSYRILLNAFSRSRDTMTAVCFLLKAVLT
ncbi:hypothetical protein Trydic_g23805 [Trypoxylus dichotomus]